MLYCSHIPSGPIRQFVDHFWICSDKPSHARERILPSGTVELVINLREDEVRVYDAVQTDRFQRFPGVVVSGTYAKAFVIDPSQHALMMGVHFKPGGAYPFLGEVVGDLANHHVALEDLWGTDAIELRERICAADRPAQRFHLLEAALTARLVPSWQLHAAVSIALRLFGSGNCESVHGVAGRVGLSQRRLIEVFTTQVGLTPKLFSRVLRFQQARLLAVQSINTAWATAAVACGYFDQSHLIRDFRQFSGLCPSDYLQLRSEHVMPNHIPAQVNFFQSRS